MCGVSNGGLVNAPQSVENLERGQFSTDVVRLRRVSGADQNPAHQVDALVRAGIDTENIHTDHSGGAKASRPQFDTVLSWLRSDDTRVITRLDLLGRSVLHLITLGADLRERGMGLKVLRAGHPQQHRRPGSGTAMLLSVGPLFGHPHRDCCSGALRLNPLRPLPSETFSLLQLAAR